MSEPRGCPIPGACACPPAAKMSEAFHKEMAETWRGIKGDFERSLEPPPPADNGVSGGGKRHKLDKSIVEQVRADLDGLIEKHGGQK